MLILDAPVSDRKLVRHLPLLLDIDVPVADISLVCAPFVVGFCTRAVTVCVCLLVSPLSANTLSVGGSAMTNSIFNELNEADSAGQVAAVSDSKCPATGVCPPTRCTIVTIIQSQAFLPA